MYFRKKQAQSFIVKKVHNAELWEAKELKQKKSIAKIIETGVIKTPLPYDCQAKIIYIGVTLCHMIAKTIDSGVFSTFCHMI